MYQVKNGSTEHSKGNKTVPEKVATYNMYRWTQTTKTGTTISTKRMKEQETRLNLQEDDDDDDES